MAYTMGIRHYADSAKLATVGKVLREEGAAVFELTAIDTVWMVYLAAACLFYRLLSDMAEPDPYSEPATP